MLKNLTLYRFSKWHVRHRKPFLHQNTKRIPDIPQPMKCFRCLTLSPNFIPHFILIFSLLAGKIRRRFETWIRRRWVQYIFCLHLLNISVFFFFLFLLRLFLWFVSFFPLLVCEKEVCFFCAPATNLFFQLIYVYTLPKNASQQLKISPVTLFHDAQQFFARGVREKKSQP